MKNKNILRSGTSGNPLSLSNKNCYLSTALRQPAPQGSRFPSSLGLALLLGAWLWGGGIAGEAAYYYASPSGSATGDGSSSRPWNLTTALSSKYGRARAGDTVWLMGGTYQGNYYSDLLGTATSPVIVRAQIGQRATLNGTITQASGGYVTYWGFEIMRDYADHDSSQSGSQPTDLPIIMGMNLKAPGIKLVNMIIHDQVSNGVGLWKEAPNSEIYGCLLYNNGWDGSDRGHGHGMYVQNEAGYKKILDNISFNNYSDGLQIYGTSATYLYNITVEGNAFLNNGIISRWPGGNNMQLGGGNAARGIVVRNNYIYSSYAGGKVNIGSEARNQDLRFENNVIVAPLRVANWHSAYFRNNLVAAPNTLLEFLQQYESMSSSTHSWDQNRYFSQELQWKPFCIAHLSAPAKDFAGWKTSTGFDRSSTTYTKGKPTGTQIYVRRNAYESGRGHVMVYNFNRQSTVSVDVSSILSSGARFEVRNAQNYFASPVLSGTYSGQSLVLPMSGLSVARPTGESSAPAFTPEFNAFVVLTLGGSTPPPPAPSGNTQTFSQSSATTVPSQGSASPYPSNLSVSGMSGTITKVTVSLLGLRHTYPDDLDILLCGPSGKKVLLMSDAGGGNALNGVNLVIDDSGTVLPDSSTIGSSTYRPTNYDTTTDTFPSPAPVGPYSTTMSAFNGISPNGTWSLYIRDDASGDSGSLASGWRLTITTGSTSGTLSLDTVSEELDPISAPSPHPVLAQQAPIDQAIIQSVWMSDNGQAVLLLNWQPGLTYVVEASSDHLTWTEVARVTAEVQTQEVADPEAVQHSLRFYRVRQVNQESLREKDLRSEMPSARW